MEKDKRNILVVDDETGILKMLRDFFSPRGFGVVTAPTSSSALSSLEENKFDVVLLDIKLPDGSGLDTLKSIKKSHPDLFVVIFTAHGYENEMVNTAMKLGADGYASKNSSLGELMDVVNNALMRQGGL